jgi:serine/threonine protein phosphatase PrpC
LIHNQKIVFPINLLNSMLIDVANGMHYLHTRTPPILHRNLKSTNLLVFSGCQIKISDFGLARKSENTSDIWLADEIKEKSNEEEFNNQFSKDSDAYSFSVLMHELIFRELPSAEFRSDRKHPHHPESKSDQDESRKKLIELMEKCRKERESFQNILVDLRNIQEQFNLSHQFKESIRVEEKFNPIKNDYKGEEPVGNSDPNDQGETPNAQRKLTYRGYGHGLKYAVSSMRGRRFTMEDKHIMKKFDNYLLFAVFDGHGGLAAAKFCSKNFELFLSSALTKNNIDLNSADPKEVENILKQVFIETDDKLLNDKVLSNPEKPDESGCTGVCAIVTENRIIIANCGDSRCVFRSDGETKFSQDHKPTHKIEKKRIKEAGGIIIFGRVNGDLAVSRALGDRAYKNQELAPEARLVSCVPDVTIHQRTENDEVLLLGCDGICDVMKSEKATEFFKEKYISKTMDPGIICKEILKECFDQGSSDNMTILSVPLEGILKRIPAKPLPNPEHKTESQPSSVEVKVESTESNPKNQSQGSKDEVNISSNSNADKTVKIVLVPQTDRIIASDDFRQETTLKSESKAPESDSNTQGKNFFVQKESKHQTTSTDQTVTSKNDSKVQNDSNPIIYLPK